jgi:hypothetical protein
MFLIKTLENKVNLLKNFKKTKFPGKLFNQKFLGKGDVNIF